MGNKPYIGLRYLSLFNWGRPPLPWDIADIISQTLDDAAIDQLGVGVTGSLCPSVLTALAYGAPERKVNAFAFTSAWSKGESWNCVIDDSPGMDKEVPWANTYLPSKNIRFWDGATPFFHSEALFVDLPFSSECVELELKFLSPVRNRLIMLGFLQDHARPDDVFNWVKQHNYKLEEFDSTIASVEYGKSLRYKLIIARSADS